MPYGLVMADILLQFLFFFVSGTHKGGFMGNFHDGNSTAGSLVLFAQI